jgi:site-specific recombinase XerC
VGSARPDERHRLRHGLRIFHGINGLRLGLEVYDANWERAAERLRQASAHWLRHTAGSHMMDGQVDLRFVRDNLGHASISTTSQYLHADDDERHRATESGFKLNW